MDATHLMTETESRLAKLYADAGLPCQINAGMKRLVIYAATPAIVLAVAKHAAPPIHGVLSDVQTDADESEETRYFMTMTCDFSRLAA